MSRYQHGYFWPSLTTPPYRPLLSADPQDYFGTELLYVGLSWMSCLCSSMLRGPQEYITYELIPTSPAVSYMSGSSNFDSFCDGCSVAVQTLLCGVQSRGLVQYCSQHSCAIAIKLFLHRLISVNVVHPCSSIDMIAVWKKLRFILLVRFDFYMTESPLIVVHAFANRLLMSVSVDETLLPR